LPLNLGQISLPRNYRLPGSSFESGGRIGRVFLSAAGLLRLSLVDGVLTMSGVWRRPTESWQEWPFFATVRH
jgi:hypothetical protein